MNWWKIIGFTAAAPVVSSLGYVINNNLNGTHIPITAGTVLLPAIPIALKGILALFTDPKK